MVYGFIQFFVYVQFCLRQRPDTPCDPVIVSPVFCVTPLRCVPLYLA